MTKAEADAEVRMLGAVFPSVELTFEEVAFESSLGDQAQQRRITRVCLG